jgi:2-oxo-4-hydroxy-4-carboxy--5-ureidoimidazoline (OHCU) decarboxylase
MAVFRVDFIDDTVCCKDRVVLSGYIAAIDKDRAEEVVLQRLDISNEREATKYAAEITRVEILTLDDLIDQLEGC